MWAIYSYAVLPEEAQRPACGQQFANLSHKMTLHDNFKDHQDLPDLCVLQV